MVDYFLNPAHDVDRTAGDYAASGRIRVPSFVAEEGLRALHGELVRRDDWRQLSIGPAGIREFDRAQRQAMTDEERERFDREVHERATLGFQYRYEGLRIPAAGDAAGHGALADFATFMAAPATLAFLEAVIGQDGLSFSDGQATAYAAGDFLTCHDDAAPGRNRVAAFVLGMTPQWRPEWGGVLLFHTDDDSAVVGHVPRFNTLDLFAVPQRHSVSYVSPSAPGRRLALTGWLRKNADG
jgi:SM-20-related protein